MKTPKNIAGQKFGRLTAIKYTHSNNDHKSCWDCICECGAFVNVTGKSLRSGGTKSCGCLKKESGTSNRLKHGFKRRAYIHPLYYTWQAMIDRCHRPNNKKYHCYGGRGIKVCDKWRHDFTSFLNDMGEKTSPKLTLERINNEGNYEPGNCKWATWAEQSMNKRTNLKNNNPRLTSINNQ